MARADVIKIFIEYEGLIHEIATFPNEYRSLMALIYDRLAPEDFGECLGMGKCATCVVKIINQASQITAFDRNEQTTLQKHDIATDGYRLSCQLQIDEHLNDLKIEVVAP